MKRVNLLLGGPTEVWPSALASNPQSIPGQWIGVDRGTLRLLMLGLTPALAVGDFDSLSKAELVQIQAKVKDIHYAKPEKDDTDSELGLKLAFDELQADTVYIYGATGARIDHFLVNLFMILEPRFRQHAPDVQIIDRQNTIRFYLAGRHTVQQESGKKYLTFANLTPISSFSIFDAKYCLDQVELAYSRSYASNEFLTDKVHFELSDGVVCVIQSSDLKKA